MVKAYVTIVTSDTYSLQSFIDEASRIGIARAIPASILKGMDWGELIAPADFKGTRRLVDEFGHVSSPTGILSIFGFFRLTNINVSADTSEIEERLGSKLADKVEVNTKVTRACGSYYIANTYKVLCSVKELVDALGGDKKYFVGGRLILLKEPIEIESTYFRGYKLIDLPISEDELAAVEKATVSNIFGYKRKERCSYCGRGVSEAHCIFEEGRAFHKKCYKLWKEGS